jgi:hypothetical protein
MVFMAFTTMSGNFLAKENRDAGYNFPILVDGGPIQFHPEFAFSPTTCYIG